MGYMKAHFPYEYNIHIMNTFDTQINSYWENVQKIYSPLQEKYDNRCYYLFQTKSYGFNPDLMIVGLNPGGNYQGAGKISQDKNAYVEIDAPWFNTLRRVFDYPNNEFLKTILEYCVGTNRYLLNTGNQGGLGNIVKEMVGDKSFANVAGELLDELVEIIKPKHIIAVHKDVYNHLAKCDKQEFSGTNAGYTRSGIPVLYVPNFSGRNKSRYYSEDKLKGWTDAIEKFLRD